MADLNTLSEAGRLHRLDKKDITERFPLSLFQSYHLYSQAEITDFQDKIQQR